MIVSVIGAAASSASTAAASSFLIDVNTLLDCGSGLDSLSTESLQSIERVLLTHAHNDHTCGLPTLLACHAKQGGPGVTIHTQQESIDELKTGLLAKPENNAFLTAQNADGLPLLRFESIEVGDTIPLPDGLATALPAQHHAPAIGWVIEGPWRALAYTGDSGPCPAFWHWAANVPSLSDIICELTYASADAERAKTEGHMTPAVLLALLEVIPPNVQIWLCHLNSTQREQALAELNRIAPPNLNIAELTPGTVIDL
jgi:ribonuclease BN (tRNA processing enzyme)